MRSNAIHSGKRHLIRTIPRTLNTQITEIQSISGAFSLPCLLLNILRQQ